MAPKSPKTPPTATPSKPRRSSILPRTRVSSAGSPSGTEKRKSSSSSGSLPAISQSSQSRKLSGQTVSGTEEHLASISEGGASRRISGRSRGRKSSHGSRGRAGTLKSKSTSTPDTAGAATGNFNFSPSQDEPTPGNLVTRPTLGEQLPGVRWGPAITVAPRSTKRYSTLAATTPEKRRKTSSTSSRRVSFLNEGNSTVIGNVTPDGSLSAITSSSGSTRGSKTPIKQEGSSQGSRRPSHSTGNTPRIKSESNSSNASEKPSRKSSASISPTVPKKLKPIIKRNPSDEGGDADDEQSPKKKPKKSHHSSGTSSDLPDYDDSRNAGSLEGVNGGAGRPEDGQDENADVPGTQQLDEESDSADVEAFDNDIFKPEAIIPPEMLDYQHRRIREEMMAHEAELARDRAEVVQRQAKAIQAGDHSEVSNSEDAQEHRDNDNGNGDGEITIYEDLESPDALVDPLDPGRTPSNSSNQTSSSKENKTETPEPDPEDGEEDEKGGGNENEPFDAGEGPSSSLELELDENNASTLATGRKPLKEIRKAKAAARKEKKKKGAPKKIPLKDSTPEVEEPNEGSDSGNGSPTPGGKPQGDKKPFKPNSPATISGPLGSGQSEEQSPITVEISEPPESVQEPEEETPRPVGNKKQLPSRTARGTPHPNKRPVDGRDEENRKVRCWGINKNGASCKRFIVRAADHPDGDYCWQHKSQKDR